MLLDRRDLREQTNSCGIAGCGAQGHLEILPRLGEGAQLKGQVTGAFVVQPRFIAVARFEGVVCELIHPRGGIRNGLERRQHALVVARAAVGGNRSGESLVRKTVIESPAIAIVVRGDDDPGRTASHQRGNQTGQVALRRKRQQQRIEAVPQEGGVLENAAVFARERGETLSGAPLRATIFGQAPRSDPARLR